MTRTTRHEPHDEHDETMVTMTVKEGLIVLFEPSWPSCASRLPMRVVEPESLGFGASAQ
jgi:hypothetical protein